MPATKSVSFDTPRKSSESSTASAKSDLPTYTKKHQVSKVCQPTGAWYDCLRPTNKPYQGFGSLNNYGKSATDFEAGTEESWTHEIKHQKRPDIHGYMSPKNKPKISV